MYNHICIHYLHEQGVESEFYYVLLNSSKMYIPCKVLPISKAVTSRVGLILSSKLSKQPCAHAKQYSILGNASYGNTTPNQLSVPSDTIQCILRSTEQDHLAFCVQDFQHPVRQSLQLCQVACQIHHNFIYSFITSPGGFCEVELHHTMHSQQIRRWTCNFLLQKCQVILNHKSYSQTTRLV